MPLLLIFYEMQSTSLLTHSVLLEKIPRVESSIPWQLFSNSVLDHRPSIVSQRNGGSYIHRDSIIRLGFRRVNWSRGSIALRSSAYNHFRYIPCVSYHASLLNERSLQIEVHVPRPPCPDNTADLKMSPSSHKDPRHSWHQCNGRVQYV